jgi:peptidoglycan/LPS O-acetylase OafA/YrhL
MYYLILSILMFTGHLPNWEAFYCGLFNFSAATAKVPAALFQYWTLCVELQFYFTFPLLLILTPERFRGWLVGLLTAGTTVLTLLSAQQTPHAQDWLLPQISGQYIMWGCLAAYLDVKSKIALSMNASVCVVLGFAAQLALHAWIILKGVPGGDVADALWKGLSTANALSLAILIFGMWRTNSPWLRSVIANDVLVYFGKISYGFYLLLPLCFFMQPAIVTIMPILAKIPAIITSFVITFLMAVVTYHYLQVPINNVRENLALSK